MTGVQTCALPIYCNVLSVANTCCGRISFRHRKWPKGQALLWHGLQGKLSQIILALLDKGGVWAGSLEPKIATWGMPRAAAICISPESLLTTPLHRPIRAIASSKEVLPHQLWRLCPRFIWEVMSRARTWSLLPPKRMIWLLGFCSMSFSAS